MSVETQFWSNFDWSNCNWSNFDWSNCDLLNFDCNWSICDWSNAFDQHYYEQIAIDQIQNIVVMTVQMWFDQKIVLYKQSSIFSDQ